MINSRLSVDQKGTQRLQVWLLWATGPHGAGLFCCGMETAGRDMHRFSV